jgi:hypothetical protein
VAWADYSVYLLEDVLNRNDIAGTVLGFSIDQVAEAGQMGRGNAVIDLDNSDGRYTPNNGGTYSDVDWFSAAIEITVGTYPSSIDAYLYAGMIVGFDLVDDGITSRVRLTVADAFSIGGRTPIADRTVSGTTTGLADFIETYWSGTYGEVQLPTLGAGAGAEPYSDDPGPTALEIDYKLADVPQGAAIDEMNAAVLPAGPGVAFPTRLFLPDPGFPLLWYFSSADKLHRGTTFATEFTFTEDASTGELPFRGLKRGYGIDQVTNSAQITGAFSGATQQTDQNTTSIDAYGARNRQYTTADPTDADALATAEAWVTKFGETAFIAQEIQVTRAMVADKVSDTAAEWLELLDCRKGWWNPASVTYTPTGGTERTDGVLITGRRIEASPSDTTVTLTLRPAANYWYFTLDSAALGILDVNRLG